MNFIEAIQSCFKKFADFKGRASKSEFWFFILFEFIYLFIAGFLLGVVGVTSEETIGIATLILMIPVLVPGIAVTARRIHDFNQSGWMQCIFIPGFFADEFLGTGYVLYIVTFALFAFYCSQGATSGKNKFGAKPSK